MMPKPLRPRQFYSVRHHWQRQQGVAIITALLVVMLAATIATYLLAQQSRALTRTERASERAQVSLYVAPTLDWARAVLQETQKSTYTATNQAWAQPIAAQPLINAGGTANVFASGLIRDEAGKFNLNNLVKTDQSASAEDIDIFKRLLKNLGLNPDLAEAVVDWLDKDSEPRANGAEDGYYTSLATPYRTANQPMVQWQELARVKGFDAKTLTRLAPFVTALPIKTSTKGRTKINVNTAPNEIMSALLPELPRDDMANLIRLRELPYLSVDDLVKRFPALKNSATILDQFADVRSKFFTVSVAITGEVAASRQTALLDASESGVWPRIIWVQAQ